VRRSAWFPAGLLFGLFSCASAARDQSLEPVDRLHVVVVHTNDVHGQFLPARSTMAKEGEPASAGGLRNLAAHVQRIRDETARTGAGLIVLDAGDWYQGTPEGLVD
jgi:5'-nucleotidase / UDP-sugar diphosphatase